MFSYFFLELRTITPMARVVEKVRAAGWRPANVDCTVVLEAPRVSPRRAAMQERIGAVVGAPVNVKASTSEGLGAVGRGEGVACWAVALVEA